MENLKLLIGKKISTLQNDNKILIASIGTDSFRNRARQVQRLQRILKCQLSSVFALLMVLYNIYNINM